MKNTINYAISFHFEKKIFETKKFYCLQCRAQYKDHLEKFRITSNLEITTIFVWVFSKGATTLNST